MVAVRHAVRLIAIAVALALGAVATGASTFSTSPRTFGGVVQDTFGTSLARVEVFLVPEPDSAGEAVRTATDDLGRFLLLDVAPGLYRVAAVKSGYGVYLGRVHTGMRSTLDVVLHPLPRDGEPGADAVTNDASWVLRVPRRSVWHDVVDQPTRSSTSPTTVAEHRRSDRVEAIDGSIEQVFAVAAASAGGWDGGLQGNATRMQIASEINERTRVAVGGRRSRLESGGVEGDLPGALSASDSTAVDLGVRVQATDESSLDVRAFWAARDTRISTPLAVHDGFQQAERVWGYDAAWRQQLDPRSTLAVEMDYAASTVRVPHAVAGDLDRIATPGTNLAVSAQGSYETVPGDHHQVRVAFGARFVDVGLPVLRTVSNGSPVVRMDDTGWNLRLEAEDTWAVHGPLSVIYGLGYHHRLAETDTSVLVPAVGGAWSDGGRALRVVVTYHAEQVWSTPVLGELTQPEDRSREAFGYQANAETGLPLGFVLQAAASFAPIGTERIGYELGVPSVQGGRPMYFAEGDSAVRETSATLRHDAGPANVFVQWTRGRVDGTLTTVVPFDVPYSMLDDSTLRYRTGRIGVDVASSGTRVVLEHRRLRDQHVDGTATGPTRAQDQVEVRLVQDLLRYPGSSWRLLLSLQAAELDGATLAYAERLAGQPLPDSHRQVNAGIAVAF